MLRIRMSSISRWIYNPRIYNQLALHSVSLIPQVTDSGTVVSQVASCKEVESSNR